MSALGPEKAHIFRIVHLDNVAWMLRNGLHCRSSPKQDPNYRTIGLPDLIAKRADRPVPIPPGGTLSDYVPFYFTSRSPMLYNVKTGHNVPSVPMAEIVIVVASLRKLASEGIEFVITDRHAKLATARFSSDLDDLSWIRWERILQSDFAYDVNEPDKKERYQAEALIHRNLDIGLIEGILCSNEDTKQAVESEASQAQTQVKVAADGGYFF